jgi:hypothetical protein
MLRITHERLTATEVCLAAEGQLLGPWVGELERSCEPFLGISRRLNLDLSQVFFADREGVALLRKLTSRGALIQGSAFLAELLRQPQPDYPGELPGDVPDSPGREQL